ncbi:glycine cleavage system protein GcvH [Metallumcola ferriviriculae]|uniref:Glycine cleavage system H protein n=1 Tax=Metallumcola ferriviriculae TaxID=3039180 RepID=A0AAU0USN2_9FIRM|nr:glycine cleavage system protein GcvH [Desulfitibacteraceae bacterium MK1]
MQLGSYTFPDDLYYDENHGWAKVDGDLVILGLSDFSQQLAGTFIHIKLPKLGKSTKQGKPVSSIESGKWVGRIYAPVTGEVVEINEDLKKKAEIINNDPYDQGWICKIKMADPAELDNLLHGDKVKEFYEAEIEKHKK